ncbi:MAG: D-aminoacyl-tRNA deacylase [Nanoarchaeota archaeon]|nr:D-aminoacyl-tRNA deacylase [Nanoarchaeota archaeon]
MNTAIIVSKKDLASMNISECLKTYNLEELNTKLYEVEEESIFSENIDKKIEADLFIFATRHQSAKEIHSLSCHVPGNWGKAEAGGEDRKLGIAPASYLKEVFLILNKENTLEGFEVTMECTHHGPYLEKPCFFIEIGSNEEQWTNKVAGNIIAKVIIEFLKKLKNDEIGNYKTASALGGTHYLATLNKHQLRSNIAIGHTCPKHNLQNLDEEMLKQALEKTIPRPDFVLLDWKGLGKEKQRIIEMLERLNIEYKRTDKL